MATYLIELDEQQILENTLALCRYFDSLWLPPDTIGPKSTKRTRRPNDPVLGDVNTANWDTLAVRIKKEAYVVGFRAGTMPWSATSFCVRHGLNDREFRRWRHGGVSDTGTTGMSVLRIMRDEDRRLTAAGF